MRDRAAVAFWLVNLVLAPVALAGYGLWVGALLLRRRRPGVSTTALGPLLDRWLRHHLGVRRDEAAARLLPAVPGVPALGLLLATGPLLLAHRLTGYVPGGFRRPYRGTSPRGWRASRLLHFDAALERHIPSVSQLVLLGAGFDTRAWRPPRLAAFEVDLPETQAVKREALRRAGVDAAGVTFVAADLAEPDWMERLESAGFDPSRPSFFLWEGVTMYLGRETTEAVLRRLGETAPGSVAAFDYATPAVLASSSRFLRCSRALARAVGEPLRGGIEPTDEFLASCGLPVLERVPFGPWGGFIVTRRPARGGRPPHCQQS